MARTVLLYVLSSLLVATAWLRLETAGTPVRAVAVMIALGLLPTVAIVVGRRWSAAAIGSASLLAAISYVFDVPVTDARPGGGHDFFGPVLGAFKDGFLTFYDTDLPFQPGSFPLMHAVVLVAIFAFSAATGVLLALRRPVGAAVALVFGVGWPATLVPGSRPLGIGVLALAGILAVLYLLRAGTRPARGVLQGLAVALVLVAVAAAASTSDAVAKGAFLSWQTWDPYNQPDDPVSLKYVWDARYNGIHFPKKKTVVLKIQVPGPKRSLYWRATTLDDYTGTHWQEGLELGPATELDRVDTTGLPAKAQNRKNWVQQDVTVEALRDIHLVGSSQPVRWQPPGGVKVQSNDGSVVVLPDGVNRDQRYTVWSYVPRVKPSQLARAGTSYPEAVDRDLLVVQGVSPAPRFGVPNRDELMASFFDNAFPDEASLQLNRPLYDVAREVVGDAPTPYAAALALEAWFRTEGGFHYTEQPPPAEPASPGESSEPALVAFATRTKQGYCQHFAGAMAVMLRMLGIPSRVAAGFTSGSYDGDKHEWTVTDHEAHAWVEVYFPGWGWMPFDPTPSRGGLDTRYSSASQAFDYQNFASPDNANLFGTNVTGFNSLRRQEERLNQSGSAANPASEGSGTVVRDKGPSIVGLALLVLAAAFALIVALKALRRAVRLAGRDPRALAAAFRRDIAGYIADQGVELPPSATLADLGDTLDRHFAVDARPFVRAVTVARFGRPGEAEAAVAGARKELRSLRRDLRHVLSAVSRFRGAISLRSLTA